MSDAFTETTVTETHGPFRLTEPEADRPSVAHTVPEYLPRAATYIHATITFQQSFEPVVVARRTANLAEFPLRGPVYALRHDASVVRRVARHATALAHGYRGAYELSIAEHARGHGSVLLHAHHGWSGRASVQARRRLGIPLVTTFYGRDLALKKGRRALRQPYSALFDEGTLFCCEGPAMADHLARLGCPTERIRLVKIGIDVSKFEFKPPERTRPLVILQAARLVEKKGIDLSLKAFSAARPRLGPSELWIVGDGELRGDLEQLADSLGLNGSVRFLGERSYAEYGVLTRQAHICIQPSRTASDGDTEGGAPTVLLEMQAVGVPIVATKHADIPSVVAAAENLVDEEDVDALADAIVEVTEHSDAEYRERVERGRTYVEREHDVRRIAARVEDVYREALGAARHA